MLHEEEPRYGPGQGKDVVGVAAEQTIYEVSFQEKNQLPVVLDRHRAAEDPAVIHW